MNRSAFARASLPWVIALIIGATALVWGLQNGLGPSDPVLVGAGDIASCTSDGDEATAELLDKIPGTIFAVGDEAYESGAPAEFAACYGPSWGRHLARTRPVPGNHEYETEGASAYFAYFGAAAGEKGKGYYSYDLGAWHIIALNSEIGVSTGSEQERWLRADLAAHPSNCTLAYWHRPRFSSGAHASDATFEPFWQALFEAGADIVVAGHNHDYERFAPQTPSGELDQSYGIREFVVGTGGRSHYSLSEPAANSEISNSDTYGVLKMTLHANSYDWQFVPEAGKTFTDSGRASCHGAPPKPTSLLDTQVTPN